MRPPPKSGGSTHEPLAQELLQKRWQDAKTNASQPHHVKFKVLQTLPLTNTEHQTRLQRLWALSPGLCSHTATTWLHCRHAPQLWRNAAHIANGSRKHGQNGGTTGTNGTGDHGSRSAIGQCLPHKPQGRDCQAGETPPRHAIRRLPESAGQDRYQPSGGQARASDTQTRGGNSRSNHCPPAADQQGGNRGRGACPRNEGQPCPCRSRSPTGSRT